MLATDAPPAAQNKPLTLPERMINSANAAHSVVQAAIDSHAFYWKEIEHCENHIQGQKPLHDSKLKELGISWMSNYNYGKARAKIEQIVGSNVWFVISAMAMASPQFRQWRNSDLDEKDSDILSFLDEPDLRLKFAVALKNAFIITLASEPRMQDFINVVEYNATAWGYCPVTRNKTDWLGCANHVRSIAFEDHTKPEECRIWCAFDILKADVLYKEYIDIRGRQSSTMKDGEETVKVIENWVVEGIEEALIDAYYHNIEREAKEAKKKIDRQEVTWEVILPKFAEDPSQALRNCKNIPIAKIYNFEANGDLTETYVVFDRTSMEKSKPGAPQGKNLLYQKNHGRQELRRFLNIIKASGFSENGFIQELRGIAKFAVEDSIRFNRQKNDLNDKLKVTGAPMFLQPSSNLGQQFRLHAHGPFTIAPSGYSLVQNQPTFDLQSHIAAMGVEEQHYARETEHFDAKISGRLSSRPTEEEVAAKSSEVRDLRTVRGMLKLADYAELFYSLLMALVEYDDFEEGSVARIGQRRFWDEVEARFRRFGITDRDEIKKICQQIDHIEVDHVTRDAQSIEAAMLDVQTQSALNRLRRMHLIAKGFPVREVEKLIPDEEGDSTDLHAIRRAADENVQFEFTKEIVYIESDPPIEHLDMHFSGLNRKLQSVEAGEDPVRIYNTLVNGLTHTAFHIQKMLQSAFYKRQAKKYLEMQAFFTKQLAIVQRMASQRVQEITDQQEQQAQGANGQPNIDPVQQAKIDTLWYHAQEKEKRTNYLAEVRRGERENDREFKQRLQQEDHQQTMQMRQQLADLQNSLAITRTSIDLAVDAGRQKGGENGKGRAVALSS